MLSITEELSKRISKVVLKYNYYTVYFSETADGTHSFESRLNRAKIERSVFIDDLKTKMLPELKSSGIYLFKKENGYQVLGRYNSQKKEFFIFTILNKDMVAKDFDTKIIIEWVQEFFNIELSENEVRLVNDSEIDVDILLEGTETAFQVVDEIIVIKI